MKNIDTRHLFTIGCISTLFVSAVTLSGCMFEKMEVSHTEYIVKYGESISLDAKTYLANSEDYLKEVVVESDIVNEEEKAYPAVGSYEITLIHGKESVIISVNVVDTVVPVICEVQEVYQVEQFGMLDISQFVIEELSEYNIALEDSFVDYAVAGKYTANLCVQDSSGNVTNQEINIEILQGTITLSESSLSLKVGGEANLKATIENMSGDVIFASSDESVVTVSSDGKVVGKSSGTAVVTASANGVYTECVVRVTSNSSGSTGKKNNSSSGTNNYSGSSGSNGTSGLTHSWQTDEKGNPIPGTETWHDEYGNLYDSNGNPTGANVHDWWEQ